MRVRGVLFDVDGTLFDYAAAEAAGLRAHLGAEPVAGLGSEGEALARWRALMVEEYGRFLAGEVDFAAQQRARVRRFLGRPGLSDAEASAWFGRYAARRDLAGTAFADAEPVLRRLAADHRLGVVSNAGTEGKRRKLAAVGLLPYLRGAFVCCDEYGAVKPAAGIFHAACAALGLPPEQVAYVGDDYTADALGARDAGLRSYWLCRGGQEPGSPSPAAGIHVLRTLHTLPAALAGPHPGPHPGPYPGTGENGAVRERGSG
ncbi:putative hydrolase [Actinacidiphila reveromycinica]|uniref:Putative hydrolase n=1 Tax=Actinacidiphila reveromycinica TaxID=659352 RepID=A0A7U3VRW9_9ACTN|nr:HAD family hydrolase [Streptomyces sp. SN-593]BBB01219.1 putative hydrolase [Streptomyces sp. SN-593]